jgi:hypothetical protein
MPGSACAASGSTACPWIVADDGTDVRIPLEIALKNRVSTAALLFAAFAALSLGDAHASPTAVDSTGTVDTAPALFERAHRVDVSNVKANDDGTGSISAVLTFGDGRKAECAYKVRWQFETFGPANGIRYQSVSEICRPV